MQGGMEGWMETATVLQSLLHPPSTQHRGRLPEALTRPDPGEPALLPLASKLPSSPGS